MAGDSEEIDAGPFGEKSERNDYCIQVEGKDLFVSKAILSAMSPIFEKFCYRKKFAEAQQARVELKDQKYQEIVTMLKCMIPHPSVEPVTDENMEVLLKLGSLYFVRFLQDNCITFVNFRVENMKHTDRTSLSYLIMVSKYNVEGVFDGLIDLLIRKVSNLSKEYLSKNDADLLPEVAHKLYRHCYFKFRSSLHVSTTKRIAPNPKTYCSYCAKLVQWLYCDLCNCPAICSECNVSPRDICPKPICVKCEKVECMCTI